MKKLIGLVIVSLLLCGTAFAVDLEGSQVAELNEHPQGRVVGFDGSELVTVWFVGGGDASIGVSGSSATPASLELIFYEGSKASGNHQEVTATRFESATYATISNTTEGSTADTVSEIVSLINSDSSGYWKAAIGRDATPGTSTTRMLAADLAAVYTTETASITNGGVLKLDTSTANSLTAGFRARSGKVNRLKSYVSNFRGGGTGAEYGETIYVTVWSGSSLIRQMIYVNDDYSTATASTVGSTDLGTIGLCSKIGESLTVGIKRGTCLGTADSNTNLSIIVGEWQD